MRLFFYGLSVLLLVTACQKQEYDLILRGGMIYDGSGKPPYKADIAINADTIAFIGDLKNAVGISENDVTVWQ